MAAPATCPFALSARSLAEFDPYLTAPATCLFTLGARSLAEFPLLCAGPSPCHFCAGRGTPSWPLLCAGPSPCHFCAGLSLYSGPALTTRGRYASTARSHSLGGKLGPGLRSRVGDRPLLRWAHGLRMSGPYFALGRVLATFALGSDSVAGRPSVAPHYAEPPRFNGSSLSPGARSRVGDRPRLRWAHGPRHGHFCAGPGSPCFALTLRWA